MNKLNVISKFCLGFLVLAFVMPVQGMFRTLRSRGASQFNFSLCRSFANQFKAFGAACTNSAQCARFGSQKFNSGSGSGKSNKSSILNSLILRMQMGSRGLVGLG